MASFTPGKTVTTDVTKDHPANVIDVDPLPPGTYQFQLVVTDDQQIQSDASPIVQIEVRAKPVAVITTPTAIVPQGQPFRLFGDKSTPQERIKTYSWTLVQPKPQ